MEKEPETVHTKEAFQEWGRRGGRPKMAEGDKGRTMELPSASKKVEMGEFMEKELKNYPDTTKGREEFWQAMAKEYKAGRDITKKDVRKQIKKQLRKVLADLPKNKAFVEEYGLGRDGKFARGRVPNRGTHKMAGEGYGTGCREAACGQGPKDYYEEIMADLNHWIKVEESYGHELDRDDLVIHFEEVLSEAFLEVLAKEKRQGLTKDEADKKALYNNRLLKMNSSPGYRRNIETKLIRKTGVKFLVPTRKTSLGANEQKVRAELSWQMFDHKVWQAACGSGSN